MSEQFTVLTDEDRFCKCGCGEVARVGEYRPGHHMRLKEHRKRASGLMSEVNRRLPRGPLSAEHGAKISKALAGVPNKLVSESLRRYWAGLSEEDRVKFRETCSGSQRDYWAGLSEEERGKRSESIREWWACMSEEERSEFAVAVSEGHKVLGGMKKYWASLSEEERNKLVRGFMTQSQPTLPEQVVDEYLQEHFPGEWAYNGTGSTVIGSKRPDFINVNGKKEVIEVFGMFWHFPEEEEQKIEHYAKHGFKCRVIWEYDCFSKELDKIFGIVGVS